MESSDGSIWVPTKPGLHRYDQNMERKSFQQMRWEWFYTMLEANDGTLWATSFGLHGSKTLWQFNGENWEWIDSIESKVNQMLEDKNGNLWVTYARYGGNSKTLKSFNIITGDWTDHLQERTVLALTESSSQQMWAGTDNGLWQFDGSNWYSQNQLAGIKITKLVESQDKSVWALAKDSLWRLSMTGWSQPNPLKGKEVYSEIWHSQRSPMIDTKLFQVDF